MRAAPLVQVEVAVNGVVGQAVEARQEAAKTPQKVFDTEARGPSMAPAQQWLQGGD